MQSNSLTGPFTLEQLDVSKNESSYWQRLGGIPEPQTFLSIHPSDLLGFWKLASWTIGLGT
jgi:hypothetical protein